MARLWKNYLEHLRLQDMLLKPQVKRLFIGLFFWLLFMFVLTFDFSVDKVSFEPGEISDKDIVASRTVSFVDEIKTKKLTDDILASVVDVYDLDVSILESKEKSLNLLFDTAAKQPADGSVSEAERLAELKTGDIVLSDDELRLLLSLESGERGQLRDWSIGMLRRYMQKGIRAEELTAARSQAGLEIAEFAMAEERRELVRALVLPLLESNVVLNQKETEKRRQSAINSVEPVREMVRKGQIIVRRGDIINESQIQIMRELGMHVGQVNWYQRFALGIFVLTVLAVAAVFMRKFEESVYNNMVLLFLLGMILFFTLGVALAAEAFSFYLGPVATGPLLMAILLNPRIGFMFSVVLALLCGALTDNSFPATLVTLLGSAVGVYSVSKKAHGYSLTRSGLLIALVNCLMIWAVHTSFNIASTQPLALECILGLISGIGSAVITTGLLPYLETAFQITTPIKLLELAQPNQPLLQRLLLEAPGTYHHSILIGNLAEAAADVIGADPIIVRVGAYYHDVGKIRRPYFFVENQFGAENPHDKLTPTLSALTITSHVRDGLELCREYNIPKVITNIVAQHHGTLLVGYFYHKAVTGEHGDCVDEADFRYEGPKPQTREAALIMIADACEAAVRSISKPNQNRIETMVRKIIKERLYDGQFDECNLTLRHLNEIGDVYIRILSSMFHSRIEYPESLKEGKKPDGNNTEQSAGGAGNRG